ncbi:MAG: site-specific DNA-methyltransferase, partial [Acidobacteriota bacterium]
MEKMTLPRLDRDEELCRMLLPYCRIKPGEVWCDPKGRHKIGCLDAADIEGLKHLLESEKAVMAIHDPPYNMVAFGEMTSGE